jgi:hypothetical protein
MDDLLEHRCGAAPPSRKSVHKLMLVSKIIRPLRDVRKVRPGLPLPALCASIATGRSATIRLRTSATTFPHARSLVLPSSSGARSLEAGQWPSYAPTARPCPMISSSTVPRLGQHLPFNGDDSWPPAPITNGFRPRRHPHAPCLAPPSAPRVLRRGHTLVPRALSWFFPDGPHGALFDPPCHIFRGSGPQGLMGGKAHHVPLQVHRPDGSTRGAFQGTRRGLPQVHRFRIDGSGKGTFRWERLRGGASHRIACRRPDTDASAPPHRVCGPRGRLWPGLGYRRRWAREAET